MSALLLLAMLQAPAGGEREILDSFKQACSRTGDFEAMKADASSAGWHAMAETADPRIERITRLGREAVKDSGSSAGATYRRTIGGRELFLVVSRYDDKSGFWGMGCRLYDFSATKPLDVATLTKWMGKPPTGVKEPAPGLSQRLWEPGWRSGVTFEASFVPAGHALAKTFGVHGNVFIAQAIGGF